MDMFVRFWGTRGSIPAPGHRTRKYGGNTSCVEVRVGDTVLVCDTGTGARELGLDLAERSDDSLELHMFFSHMHWDHIQGFPFFVPAYAESTTLYVYETSPGEDRVQRLLHGQMQSDHFPVSFTDLGSRIVARHVDAHGGTSIGDITVRCFEQHHPGRSFAFSFEHRGKKVVYATDNEIDMVLSNREASLTDLDVAREAPAELIRFFEGASLLIADGQYTDGEYPRKVGWGHARANTVVDAAVDAGVEQCAIFHHDPLHTDDQVDAIIAEGKARADRRGAELTLFGAREGLELRV